MKRYALLIVMLLGGIAIGIYVIQRPIAVDALQLDSMYNTNNYTVLVQPDTKPAPGKTVTFTVSVANAPTDLSAHVTVASHNLRDFWSYDDSYEIDHIDAQHFRFTHTFTEADTYTIWIEMHNAVGHLHETHIIESTNPSNIDFLATVTVDLRDENEADHIADVRDKNTDGNFHMHLESPFVTALTPKRLRFHGEKINGEPATFYTTGGDWYVLVDPVSKLFLLHSIDENISDEAQRTTPELTLPHAGRYALWLRTFSANENPNSSSRFGEFITTTFVIEALPE
ncbi:hypothetical protein COU78_02160 [Candidatus Peregrinibacteria bacterium CG10_big_fil_rev_8_21_14_0_10_49_24]|nr:MAG: hypothetical protein COV83_03760 [Candidatus Peregrinibacteria bacterium CG11_big_fil_rev_8_21_14_0_20_49_14]PIR51281.1 MAG: hypothetical protein COU78_02160 [Candidatus Peregrinibacteria bacterium CG10_big_fil_rev_8_21_14_0_10_49_24]PJA68089.1 MAG: hypothetical protein CO157_00925 [Candidatus Peregrinibacteria bacterium CG_4_9_14_3_um_filter_49_12]